ncbi:MAG: hypothetical protein RMJ15_02370 [Nitrososphaerota archaeon]|nr:hypothetical protein [Nitrososphaerota archaeon]
MDDLDRNERLEPWSKMDALMLIFCFIAFAVLGFFLAKQILF